MKRLFLGFPSISSDQTLVVIFLSILLNFPSILPQVIDVFAELPQNCIMLPQIFKIKIRVKKIHMHSLFFVQIIIGISLFTMDEGAQLTTGFVKFIKATLKI